MGRPITVGAAFNIQIRVPLRLKQKLAALAEARGCSQSEVVRQFIEHAKVTK